MKNRILTTLLSTTFFCSTTQAAAALPSVSGGGLTTGKTQDYVIDLKPGECVYSCPLNPTPDYRLVVK